VVSGVLLVGLVPVCVDAATVVNDVVITSAATAVAHANFISNFIVEGLRIGLLCATNAVSPET
jgi:hypothetical protein